MPTSYGGIRGKEHRVREALETAYRTVSNGAKFFIRSDIQGFFTKIPRPVVISQIAAHIQDKQFLDLLEAATTVELNNLDQLKSMAELFPIYEIGVAQGCCLSPLMGNILLYEFDQIMNTNGIVTLRYIDDFIIFAEDERTGRQAFRKAKKLLSKYRLSVYDPAIDHEKAEQGQTTKGFTFLGCDILPGFIRPSKKAQKRLLNKVQELLKKSADTLSRPDDVFKGKLSLIETLSLV